MKVLLGRMRVTCVLAALMIVATWGSELEISHGTDIEESAPGSVHPDDATKNIRYASAGISGAPLGKRRKRPLSDITTVSAKKQRSPTAFETLLAGTAGGVAGVIVSYPLDTLRVRVQTGGNHQLRPFQMFSKILRESGISGIYRGVLSPIMGAAFVKGAIFGGYGFFQSLMRRLTAKDGSDLALWAICVSAMGSALVGSLVVTPVERIKVVMQANPFRQRYNPVAEFFARSSVRGGSRGYPNVWGCARGLVADLGVWRGLYKGLGLTILRVVPGYASYFATYEGIKRFLLWRDRNKEDGIMPSPAMVMLKTAASGAAAGVMAWLPVYPVDVLKSRIQSDAGEGAGTMETAAYLYQHEGYRPFLRGLSPTLWRAVVNHAATFVVYEATMGFLLGGAGGPGKGTQEGD